MPPFRPVRRTQIVAPFGVGAIVDFPDDEALMTAGLDAWPNAEEDCPHEWKIVEERLQKKLGVDHFRMPPDFRLDDVDQRYIRQHIPFVRFPRWHYCPKAGCGLMTKRPLFGGGVAKCRGERHQKERFQPRLVPVRFIAVCPLGHIEDFPFMEWVHDGQPPVDEANHNLHYKAGRSAALAGIAIECSCGRKKTLAGAFNYEDQTGGALHQLSYDCRGDQPWLGISDGAGTPCGQFLRALQRGGSNVYFPQTYSSIYLPLWGEDSDPRIVRILEDVRVWELLSNGLDEGKYLSRERVQTIATMRGVDPDKLFEAATRKLNGDTAQREATEEEYRRSEYDAFLSSRGNDGSDLLVEETDIGNYSSELHRFIERISLVRKLRETRALQGFSRLLPPDNILQPLQPIALKRQIKWRPAIVVRGEGIFFKFRSDALLEWAGRDKVLERVRRHSRTLNNSRMQRRLPDIPVTPELTFIHTFAHTLIRQLSFDCGYGSAALRERIYCNLESEEPMHGLLIYTAAGDSEGTLGGLVRKGEAGNLESSVLAAIRGSAWCSSDPVCVESAGQGTDNANLAACHACALLPETSCEYGNRLLDRAAISGLPGMPSSGFLSYLIP